MLKNRDLHWAIVFFVIQNVIVVLGNPRAFSFLYWHHFPELICFFFLGRFVSSLTNEAKYVLMLYLGNAVVSSFVVSNSLLAFLFDFLFMLWLQIPLLLGYFEKTVLKRSR